MSELFKDEEEEIDSIGENLGVVLVLLAESNLCIFLQTFPRERTRCDILKKLEEVCPDKDVSNPKFYHKSIKVGCLRLLNMVYVVNLFGD